MLFSDSVSVCSVAFGDIDIALMFSFCLRFVCATDDLLTVS